MKYLQGRKGFDLKLCESEIPVPVHNQALVRVLACGICGTDLNFLRTKENYTPLGHEISAIVVSIGESVTKVSVGDMVVAEDCTACGSCQYCKNGEPYLCRNMTGLNGQSGMGEYLLVHESVLVPCRMLTKEQATFVEPTAVALTACLNAQIREDRPLIIWGVGPLALMCVSLGKYYHAAEIICVGHGSRTARQRKRRELALSLGASAVYDVRELKGRKKSFLDPCSVIVSSPPSTVPDAIELCGYGSRIVPFGIALDASANIKLNMDDLILQKKSIFPVLTEPASLFPRCIELIERGVIPTEKLLTHQIPLGDLRKFQTVYTEDEPVVKGIIVNE